MTRVIDRCAARGSAAAWSATSTTCGASTPCWCPRWTRCRRGRARPASCTARAPPPWRSWPCSRPGLRSESARTHARTHTRTRMHRHGQTRTWQAHTCRHTHVKTKTHTHTNARTHAHLACKHTPGMQNTHNSHAHKHLAHTHTHTLEIHMPVQH